MIDSGNKQVHALCEVITWADPGLFIHRKKLNTNLNKNTKIFLHEIGLEPFCFGLNVVTVDCFTSHARGQLGCGRDYGYGKPVYQPSIFQNETEYIPRSKQHGHAR